MCNFPPPPPFFPKIIVWGEHGFGRYDGFFSHKLAQIIFVVELCECLTRIPRIPQDLHA